MSKDFIPNFAQYVISKQYGLNENSNYSNFFSIAEKNDVCAQSTKQELDNKKQESSKTNTVIPKKQK